MRIWFCGLALVMAGCGGGTGGRSGSVEPATKVALDEVGELYRVYTVTYNKPPSRFEDLKSLGNVGPGAIKALKAGEVVVLYGATMADLDEGASHNPSDEVLAYEKKVPDGGGDVLMLNRSIKTMTADEFKSAKKAGKGH